MGENLISQTVTHNHHQCGHHHGKRCQRWCLGYFCFTSFQLWGSQVVPLIFTAVSGLNYLTQKAHIIIDWWAGKKQFVEKKIYIYIICMQNLMLNEMKPFIKRLNLHEVVIVVLRSFPSCMICRHHLQLAFTQGRPLGCQIHYVGVCLMMCVCTLSDSSARCSLFVLQSNLL